MLATALALFAWYVIYTNKEATGKPHLVSYHAQLGALCLAGYVAMSVVGAVALDAVLVNCVLSV